MHDRQEYAGLAVQVQKSSVNGIVGSRNEASGIRAEKKRQRRDFLRLSHAADRLQLRQLLHHLLLTSGIVLVQKAVDKWSVHARGGNTVAADIVVHVIARYRIRHGQHRTFAHAIGKAICESGESGDGSKIQNHAAAGSFHGIDHRVHAVVHALHIDAVNAIKLVFGRTFQFPDMGYTCIIHKNVNGARSRNSPEDFFDLLLIGNVTKRPLGSTSSLMNLARGLFRVLFVDFNNVD